MTTIIVNENTEEGRSLMTMVRAIRRVSRTAVQIITDKRSEEKEKAKFADLSLDTQGYKFNREAANER